MKISKFFFVRLYNLFLINNKIDNLYYDFDRIEERDKLNKRAEALKGLIHTDVDEIVDYMLETYPGKVWSFSQLVNIIRVTQSKKKLINDNIRWIEQTFQPFINMHKSLMRVSFVSYYTNVDGYTAFKHQDVLKL